MSQSLKNAALYADAAVGYCTQQVCANDRLVRATARSPQLLSCGSRPAALGGDHGVLNLHVPLRLSTGDSLPSLPEHAPALALAALLSGADSDFRVLCFPHLAGPAHAFVNLTRACSFACVLRGKMMMMMMDNARPCFEPPPLLALI